jgi:hypothetical protein
MVQPPSVGDRGEAVIQELTAEQLDRFLRTEAAFASLEATHGREKEDGPLRGLAEEEAVLLLEANAEVRQVLMAVGWTARDYLATLITIFVTLIAIERLDAGHEPPGGVSEANIRFLRSVPAELAQAFSAWKSEFDPYLRELRDE